MLGNDAALTQVFSNLLVNALEFDSPERPPKVRVWGERRDEYVRLWFEDNGIGIWEMFQKLDQQADGTGVGLALVKKAVERMNRKAGVESEPGQGGRFWVELKAV